MNLADVFIKANGEKKLKYEDFQPLGWTYNDYFTYMSLCDEIRAATIVDEFNGKKNITTNDDLQEMSLINQRVKALFDWLGLFSEQPMPEPIMADHWMRFARTYDCHNYTEFRDDEPNPNLLYQSLYDFTVWIEKYIHDLLFDKPLSDSLPNAEQIENLPPEELEKTIDELNQSIGNMNEPVFPPSPDSYYSLTKWAKEKKAYLIHKNDLEQYRDKYEKQLRKNSVSIFDPKNNTLYIYRNGNIICKRFKHEMVNVNCVVPTLTADKAIISAQYCRNCRKFIMSDLAYETYMKRYRMIPIKFECVNDDGRFPTGKLRKERAEFSPLALAGYNVSKKDNYSSESRKSLLAELIQNGVMKKSEIINYLELFIATNGNNERMFEALTKWESDLKFVLSYNMENQEFFNIEKIKKY